MKYLSDLLNTFIFFFVVQETNICCLTQTHDFLLSFFLNFFYRFCDYFKAFNQFRLVLWKLFAAFGSNTICLLSYFFNILISLSFVFLLAFLYDFRPFWMKSSLFIFCQFQWIFLINLFWLILRSFILCFYLIW